MICNFSANLFEMIKGRYTYKSVRFGRIKIFASL